MTLAVVDAERVARETAFARERERHRRIHAAGNEHDAPCARASRSFARRLAPERSCATASGSAPATGRRESIRRARAARASCRPAKTAPDSATRDRARRRDRAPIRSRSRSAMHDLDLIARADVRRDSTTDCARLRPNPAPSDRRLCARAHRPRRHRSRPMFRATLRSPHRKVARAARCNVFARAARRRSRRRVCAPYVADVRDDLVNRRAIRRRETHTRYRTRRSAAGSRSGARIRSASRRRRASPCSEWKISVMRRRVRRSARRRRPSDRAPAARTLRVNRFSAGFPSSARADVPARGARRSCPDRSARPGSTWLRLDPTV